MTPESAAEREAEASERFAALKATMDEEKFLQEKRVDIKRIAAVAAAKASAEAGETAADAGAAEDAAADTGADAGVDEGAAAEGAAAAADEGVATSFAQLRRRAEVCERASQLTPWRTPWPGALPES